MYSITPGLSKLDIFSAFHPHVYLIRLICSTSREPPYLCPPTRHPHGRWLPRRSSPALPDDAAACGCAGSAPEMADMPRGTATIDLRQSRGRHSRPVAGLMTRATQGDAQCPLQPPARVAELSRRLMRHQRRQRRQARAVPRLVDDLVMRRTATATRTPRQSQTESSAV